MTLPSREEIPSRDVAASAGTAPRELNRLEVLRGLRYSTWDGAFSSVWATLTTGAFLTGFALWLGANDVEIGLLTALPTFAGLVQIVSSYTGERQASRQRFTAWYALAARTLWLPILLLPVLLPRSAALVPFLLLFALSYVLLNVPVPAWTSWMSDLVPPSHRGRFFARRNMIAGIVGMAVGLPAAWFLDTATNRHHWERLGFGALFGASVIGGMLSFVCLLRQPEPPKRPASFESGAGGFAGVSAYFRTPLADTNFRRLILFNIVFGLGQYFAAPFYTVYALQNLHLNYLWLQILGALTSIASLASMPLWGYLADKFGDKPLLALGICGVFTLPITWMLTTPDNPTLTLLLLAEVNLAGGLFWAGVGLTQFNLLIRLSPSDKTPVYVATMAAVTGLTGGLAPMTGSAVMHSLEGRHFQAFGLHLLNFHITFFIAALLRLSSLLFLRPVRVRDSTPAREVLQQLGRSRPRAWLHIRQLQGSGGEEARLRATGALAETRTRLAVSELEAALTDPSQAVREEAARALGEIGDPGAVEALLAALRDPSAGIAAEAASALGRIGDRRANVALIALLRDADTARRDRIAVLRALGQLGGREAVEALLSAWETEIRSETCEEEIAEEAVRALGPIGDGRVVASFAARVAQPDIPRGLRLALIQALGELGDRSTSAALRDTLPAADAEPLLLPPLADALARLDDSESVLPLLDRLCALESPVARRQVAYAVGALLGEGEGIYGLLGQEPFARDAAVSRLLQERPRRLRALPAAAPIEAAQEAYLAGDYPACLRALQTVAQTLPASRTERSTLCRRVIEYTASHGTDAPPLEIVLIALFALRAALDDA